MCSSDLIDFFLSQGFIRVSSNLYFGNRTYNNQFKDKPLAIVGTPHNKEIIYFSLMPLFGCSESEINSITMGLFKVNRKNCRFSIRTYDNLLMRELHLGKIEYELMNIISRAFFFREF